MISLAPELATHSADDMAWFWYLQEQRNILALAVGLKGIAAIRAVLNWAPVQAHATSHKVTAYYVTKSPQTAAFLAEWDQWREAGVSSHCYLSQHLASCNHM